MLVLGLDLSTQTMSAVVADFDSQEIVAAASIPLDSLGYGTTNGVIHRGNSEVVVPSALFVAALDAVLVVLKSKVDLANVAAISGCGQQHGSIFWAKGAKEALATLDSSRSLADQLANVFCIPEAPIWMDSSTTNYCRKLEVALGGPTALANLTGSRAYERFTGPQIAKQVHENATNFAKCERIGLISSLLPSLLTGTYAGIDQSDASGMNILDIHTKNWSPKVTQAIVEGSTTTAETLLGLLGDPDVPHIPLHARVAPYFIARYGFNAGCRVVPFTGDNPSTLAGLGVGAPGDLAVSLGTSDTAFVVVKKEDCIPNGEEGHVLVNPVDANSFIIMLCFKNGSLVREKIRDDTASGTKTWTEFNELVLAQPVGNNGVVGFFHPDPEITPPTEVPATHIFSAAESIVPSVSIADFAPGVVARAVIESQMLRLRHHTRKLGVRSVHRVLVSGGASANSVICQILSDVFNAPVVKVADAAVSESAAAYGGVLRAIHALKSEAAGSDKFVTYEPAITVKVVSEPNSKNAVVYEELLPRFAVLEAKSCELSK
ncbi:hypothetical protein HK100_004203 [Physocladia obscura]|uniref:Xylulose kinase n=1 Tax=Physocladia obscura TaxID=109957 RepID=A0AAD5SVC5_9FUNG|nr:hypothetical protein HK100_004203 [Physocladia obscura]